MRFLHTSDWQLGMTRHFLTAEAQARFAQDRIDVIRTLGGLALEHQAAFIVVAGDVFESNRLSYQTVVRAVDALAQLPVPVFLLPGNHDPLDAASIFDTTPFRQAPPHVVVLRDTRPMTVPGLPGVEVVGAPWTSKRPVTDLCADMLKGLGKVASGGVRVGVAHGQVDTLAPDQDRPDNIALAAVEVAVLEHRLQYLALGDRHSATPLGETGAVWYSGAPVATDFDEVAPNRALLVALDPVNPPAVTQLPTGTWQFAAHHHELAGAPDIASLRAWLERLPNKERTVLKLSFTGTINLQDSLALESLITEFEPYFAGLRRHARQTDLAIAPDTLDRDAVALVGYAKDAWDELVAAAAGEGANAEVARAALALFYRLS
jgi:DNA repair exonuclease SbcCD nuclease subunit